jgi:hypothetical protein
MSITTGVFVEPPRVALAARTAGRPVDERRDRQAVEAVEPDQLRLRQ